MKNKRTRFKILLTGCFIMAMSLYIGSDTFIKMGIITKLHTQAHTALNSQLNYSDLSFNGDKHLLKIKNIRLTSNNTPHITDNKTSDFSADEVIMKVKLNNILQRQLTIRELSIYKPTIHLKYYAKNNSNLGAIKQHFLSYLKNKKLQQIKIKHQPVWEIYDIALYNIHFILTDIDGSQVINATIPKITVPVVTNLMSQNKGKQQIISALIKSLLIETIKGGAKGSYNIAKLKKLIQREFKDDLMHLMKEKGVKTLISKYALSAITKTLLKKLQTQKLKTVASNKIKTKGDTVKSINKFHTDMNKLHSLFYKKIYKFLPEMVKGENLPLLLYPSYLESKNHSNKIQK